MAKSLVLLSGKKVEIVSKGIGVNVSKSYKGVVTSVYIDGGGSCTFIALDTGELINTLYIATITILD